MFIIGSCYCGKCTFNDSPDFKLDKSWDGKTRRIGFNAFLLDDFDATESPMQSMPANQ